MDNCILCKIAHKEIEAHIVYEDAIFLGFLDVYPASVGHTLLIPKKHIRWVHDVEPYSLYWESARVVMRMLHKTLSPQWIQYFTHGVIPHAHIHIIPRYDDVRKARGLLKQSSQPSSQEQLKKVLQKINRR